MKILVTTGMAFAAMTTVVCAQQPPSPQPSTPAEQTQPTTPSTTVVPEVMNTANDISPPDRRDAPRLPRGPDMEMRGHQGHMPPPPSKAAHFKIKSGGTMIDVKCADDEPTKVCADVLMQIMDKLQPSSDGSDDDRY